MNRSSVGLLALVLMLAIALSCAGCGGRQPNPVQQFQQGDNQKTCEHLKCEIDDLQSQMTCKIGECDNTTGKNVALGMAGAVLFFPALFFMDLSDADQIELEALRTRYNTLVKMCAEKNCGYEYKQIAQARPEEPAQDATDFDSISATGK